VALEQNKGRRPHSHSGNQESNHSSSAEVKNASEIKKRESAPLSEKEQDLKAQIARGKRLQEDRPTGREQGKEDLSFLDKKLSQEGKREKNVDFYTLPKERNEEKRKSSLDILQVNSPNQIEEELEEYYDEKNKKKKSLWKKVLLISVIEILTLILIFCTGYVVRYMNIKPDVQFNTKNVKNDNIDVKKQEQMQGYWTIAVFGVDSRDGGVGRGANADVQIIVCIDRGTGEVKLASVFRDTYLNLAAGSRFAKINEAYADGGPEQAGGGQGVPGQDQRCDGHVGRARRVGAGRGLADAGPLVRGGPGPDVEPADHADRVARLAGRAVRGRGARGPHRPQPGDGRVDLHFDGLLPPEPGGAGVDGIVDDAAQGQPDPL